MAVRTLPLEIELVIYAGTTFRREFRWLPDGVAAVDFTDWSASMLIGPQRAVALTELSTINGGIVLTTTGQILLNLSPAATKTLPAGTLSYSLDLTDPSDFIMRFMRGRVSIVHDVEPLP